MGIKCPKCQHENPEDTLFCGKCGTLLRSVRGTDPTDVGPDPRSGRPKYVGPDSRSGRPSGDIPDLTETLETPKEELTRGTTLANRYEIIEELGKGGMGRVYRVEDTKLKQEVALKLIKPEIAKDKKTIERFRNELKLAREIAHRNVCRMYDLNEEKGTHYITMEYVRGEDLRSLIRRIGQLPIGKSISIATQICEGLSEAHRLGVVHRDLKSNNIMIDKEGNVRIMDFGIARSLEAKGITGAGVMIGTPEYMSPEQVEGKEVDQRSDIYSLGVILYEMLTGRVPFEGDTPFTIGMKHKGETPKNPKELNTQISDDLNRLILRCLEKEKDKRYQSAGEVRSELTNMEKGIPTTEKEIPEKKPLTSREITLQFSMKKLFIPAAVVIALVIIFVAVFMLLPDKKAPPIPSDKPSLAILYFENNSGDSILDNWRSGLSEMLITDLSQSKFLHVLSSDRIYSLLEKQNLLEKEKYSTEDLEKVASQGGVSHVIRGSYITAGDKFIISASLMKAETAQVISSIREEGVGEASITESLDMITKQIKTDLKLSEEQISSDLDKKLAQITTNSSEAFKYYSEGEMLHTQGRYHEAIPLFQRAIAIDPEFAMAYRKLGHAYSGLGLAHLYKENMERAMELKDRLSDKERFLIEGDYYGISENTFDKGIAAYENALELYPDYTTANNNLAFIFFRLEQWDKAIPYFERAIKAKIEFALTYRLLASCYLAIGENNKAKEILDSYLENIGDSAEIHRGFAAYYQHLGEYDLALSEVEKALSIDPTDSLNLNAQATVYKYQGDLEKAEDTIWKLTGLTDPAGGYFAVNRGCSLNLIEGNYKGAKVLLNLGLIGAQQTSTKWAESDWHTKLAYVHSQTGHHESALKECDQAWESAVQASMNSFSLQRFAMHMKGLVQLANQSIDEAQKTADRLREFIEAGMHKKSMRLYYHLMGQIELENSNFLQAIGLFELALSLTSLQTDEYRAAMIGESMNELFIGSLASALFRSGDLKKAQDQYERLISLTPGGVFYGDQYTKSFYMLGRICEQQGDTAKAIEHYEKFLDLWKDADPGIAEAEDARKRLAVLKSH
jgi:serine/threonine protein kinase/Tfp pilus assembly protein PilF